MAQRPREGASAQAWQAVIACTAALAIGWIAGCTGPISKGMKLEQQGQHDAAIAIYQQVVDKDPTSSEAVAAQLLIADVYMTDLERPGQAIETYGQVAAADPSGEAGLTARYKMALHYFRI